MKNRTGIVATIAICVTVAVAAPAKAQFLNKLDPTKHLPSPSKLDPSKLIPTHVGPLPTDPSKIDPSKLDPTRHLPNPSDFDPTKRIPTRIGDPTVPNRPPGDWLRAVHASPGDIIVTRSRTTFYGYYGHAALVEDPDNLIESYAYGPGTDQPGVVHTSWDLFRRRTTVLDPRDEIALLRIKGVTPDQVRRALDYARARVGHTPYRWPVTDGTDNTEARLFCSELVYLAYLRGAGLDIARHHGARDKLGVVVSPDDLLSDKTYVVARWRR